VAGVSSLVNVIAYNHKLYPIFSIVVKVDKYAAVIDIIVKHLSILKITFEVIEPTRKDIRGDVLISMPDKLGKVAEVFSVC
jgi:hypothetical protein